MEATDYTLAICSNVEHVRNSLKNPELQIEDYEEIVDAAKEAAEMVAGDLGYETGNNTNTFRDWNGGKYYHGGHSCVFADGIPEADFDKIVNAYINAFARAEADEAISGATCCLEQNDESEEPELVAEQRKILELAKKQLDAYK